MDRIEYRPTGVCASRFEADIENGIILRVAIRGGCAGNTQGVAALLAGMPVEEAIKRLEGIKCGFKSTSCPDQLAKALKQYVANQSNA